MRTIVGPCRRAAACLSGALTALALLVLAAPAHASHCPFADAQPGQAAPADLASATICLLNERRAGAGLDPLQPSEPLAATASEYARYMVSDAHFGHEDESGHNVVWRVLRANPSLADRWSVIGENLGWGTYAMATPRAMVAGWMESPSHRDNILFPRYDEVGIGIVSGAPVEGRTNALTYTTVFGTVAQNRATTKRKRPPACRRARKAATRAARRRARRACRAQKARRAARRRAESAARG